MTTAPTEPAAADAVTRETPWTSGPWHLEDPLGPGILSIVAGGPEVYDWKHIAQISTTDETDEVGDEIIIPPEEAKANAHLIAAAPDLYAALKDMMALWNDTDGKGGTNQLATLTAAAAALSRATEQGAGDVE